MFNLDPQGLAAVALFFGVTVLITYLTRENADAQEIISTLNDLDI